MWQYCASTRIYQPANLSFLIFVKKENIIINNINTIIINNNNSNHNHYHQTSF